VIAKTHLLHAEKIAHMQLETVFSREMDPTAQQQQAQELLQMFQFGEMMEQPTCAVCGKVAMQRCSRCKTEWFGIPLPAWPICWNRLFTLAQTSQASQFHLPFPCSGPSPLHP
jgi:hypothetical protein